MHGQRDREIESESDERWPTEGSGGDRENDKAPDGCTVGGLAVPGADERT